MVSGNSVALRTGARIDAAGAIGGGLVLIGGDVTAGQYIENAVHPGHKPVPPAETTTVESGVVLIADATVLGHGGEIVVSSLGLTTVKGSLSARGGVSGGAGGYIETSGHSLDVSDVSVDIGAPSGSTGNWVILSAPTPSPTTVTTTTENPVHHASEHASKLRQPPRCAASGHAGHHHALFATPFVAHHVNDV